MNKDKNFSLVEVSKSFSFGQKNLKVLKDINVTMNHGETISIVGPSGSGKSTLLSLIGTLDSVSTGKITYGERDLTSYSHNEKSNFRLYEVGFIFQQFHLLPTLNVLENVLSPLINTKVTFDKKERALELLELVGLKDKIKNLPSQLSGGQQQRVAIARALVNEPSWILADEPTGNLDSENSEMIFETIWKLHKEKKCGIIYVTHDLNLAKKADRMIQMKDGEIVENEVVNL